jgi:uncharacterized ferritin-like protein (DUF455 family)
MPRRRAGSGAGRAALLHAVAHIELNAINLALDMAGRFAFHVPDDLRDEFVRDWLKVADDEARHFIMIDDRLSAFNMCYGDLPAHEGLWQAAERTAHDVLARLVIAPLVFEARGLDVTPGMIGRLERSGDEQSAEVLRVIYREELDHVATGAKWFRRLAAQRDLCAEETFRCIVREYMPGGLKRPFNEVARARADLPVAWYGDLVGSSS